MRWKALLRALEVTLVCIGVAMMLEGVSSAKLAQAEGTNYTVEIDEQDGSAVVYVENHDAITEDENGLQIRKKGEE